MKLKSLRPMDLIETKSVDSKVNGKNFAKKLLETFNARSSKLAIAAAVAFALWQTPSIAANKKMTIQGARDYRLVVEADNKWEINWHNEFWKYIIIPLYDGTKYVNPKTYKNVKGAKCYFFRNTGETEGEYDVVYKVTWKDSDMRRWKLPYVPATDDFRDHQEKTWNMMKPWGKVYLWDCTEEMKNTK